MINKAKFVSKVSKKQNKKTQFNLKKKKIVFKIRKQISFYKTKNKL